MGNTCERCCNEDRKMGIEAKPNDPAALVELVLQRRTK